jgi:hypothetical protein
MIASSIIGIVGDGLHDHFLTIKVFISDNLQNRLPSSKHLDLDHSYILHFISVHQCL